MIYDIKHRGFDELGLDDRSYDLYERFIRKDHASFRNRVDAACKMEPLKIFQKVLVKYFQ